MKLVVSKKVTKPSDAMILLGDQLTVKPRSANTGVAGVSGVRPVSAVLGRAIFKNDHFIAPEPFSLVLLRLNRIQNARNLHFTRTTEAFARIFTWETYFPTQFDVILILTEEKFVKICEFFKQNTVTISTEKSKQLSILSISLIF